ncbi:MAG: nucleotide exchange factor GrpE [Helicobacteraceae bacterium]|nr:nucleotide exchange factor GrpE [Helicobacteraceae bacterium]
MSEELERTQDSQEAIENVQEETQENAREETQNETIETLEIKEDFEAKYKEAQDRYLRTYAEFENIKKRLEKEKYQAIDYASEGFAKDLLPVIDALEMALKIEEGDHFAQLKEGVDLTKSALIKAFEKHGISAVSHDSGFDPNLHEAIMQSSDEALDENAIAQVLQQGWRYKERLLRPSLVSVNKRS